MRDKLSILLNITGSGIYYTGPILKTWQWYGEVGKIALAVGAPFVLCATSPQSFADGEPSWLRLPSVADYAQFMSLEIPISGDDPHGRDYAAITIQYSIRGFSVDEISINN